MISTQVSTKKAAHFLLIPELMYSPPNEAIINALLENGYQITIFAPGIDMGQTSYGKDVFLSNVSYSWIWLAKNLLKFDWFRYDVFSGTSEDPLLVVGILSLIYNKKSFSLVDEIKSGSYRGDRSVWWKRICKWAIKRSSFQIVNDRHRINLLKDYVGIEKRDSVIVYPGCFRNIPERTPELRKTARERWGFSEKAFVVGASGGFNLTAGADWLVQTIQNLRDVYAVIQPLGTSDLERFLLRSIACRDRMYLEEKRLTWQEAWISAQGLDVGMSIYTNQAPQFQAMGISSNRLCMFIAMGVPVIASRQKSFAFIEEYGCGVLVDDYESFVEGLVFIRNNQDTMVENCKRCCSDYISSNEAYLALKRRISNI